MEKNNVLTAVRSTESRSPSNSGTVSKALAGTSSIGIVLMTSEPFGLVTGLPFFTGDAGKGRGGIMTEGTVRRDFTEELGATFLDDDATGEVGEGLGPFQISGKG